MVIVKRRELSLAEKLYLPSVVKGLMVTFRKMFQPRVTRQYPEEGLPTTEVIRGQPSRGAHPTDRPRHTRRVRTSTSTNDRRSESSFSRPGSYRSTRASGRPGALHSPLVRRARVSRAPGAPERARR